MLSYSPTERDEEPKTDHVRWRESLNCSRASTSNGARSARLTWSAPASTYSPMRSTTSSIDAAEHAGAHAVGDRAELLAQALLGPRQADVDGAADLGRVAPDVGAVAVQHVALGGERRRARRTARSTRRRSGRRCAACASRRRRRPRSAACPAPGGARCGRRVSREPLARRTSSPRRGAGRAGTAMPSSSWSMRVPIDGNVDAVGVVLDLGPAGADAHRRPAAGEVVDRRDRLGQHGRVAVADRVHERAALAPARSRRPARRAWRRPRGRRRRRARRWRRRSGPRSRSSRSRAPRSASTAAAARRRSCAAGRCAPRSASCRSSSSDRSPVRETAAMPRATVATTNPTASRSSTRRSARPTTRRCCW